MDNIIFQVLSDCINQHKPKRILVGFSGGMDSSVLLHAISQLNNSIPIIAIHIHHGLSVHADQWLSLCEQQCKQLKVHFVSERVSVPRDAGSLEQAARLARYEVFEKYIMFGDALLLGHHQDDQIETFMMRLMRGSGMTGLTAMENERSIGKGILLRPLLSVSREQIEQYANHFELSHVDDESNDDISFDRNWWRHQLLPTLNERYPQANQSIVKTISILQTEHKLLNDLIDPIYQQVVDNQGRLDSNKLGRQSWSIQCQLIRKWLEQHNRYPLLADKQIRVLLAEVMNARIDAEPVFRWQDNEVRRHNGKLYVMPSLPEVNTSVFLQNFNGNVNPQLPAGQLKWQPGLGLKPSEYQLALYQGTLKARPINRPNKALKKWFQEFDIPPWQRPFWPVLLKNGEVVAVPGLFVCQGYACEQGWQFSFQI
ncbi:tRNA lysidine(34) synthetase TilS [Oceaniserpentilla sp. 4NH20-0058]|uniref:tRNA lysidine(34) synthetase TilS n=1 Tax=Oceaniserpentilla sp. 4NH20-0058 TaxID=3127660 RepID=UPI0031091B81